MMEGLTGWPAGIAVVVGAVLVGFRIYLQTKDGLRGDAGKETVADGYKSLIDDLQKELVRRGKALDDMNRIADENTKLRSRVSDLERQVGVLEATVRAQLKERRL